ncbi:hypothetical protein GCM10009075_42080 [Sphingomonas trueperi]
MSLAGKTGEAARRKGEAPGETIPEGPSFAWQYRADQPSTLRRKVSGRKINPNTSVAAATTTGYQKP